MLNMFVERDKLNVTHNFMSRYNLSSPKSIMTSYLSPLSRYLSSFVGTWL